MRPYYTDYTIPKTQRKFRKFLFGSLLMIPDQIKRFMITEFSFERTNEIVDDHDHSPGMVFKKPSGSFRLDISITLVPKINKWPYSVPKWARGDKQ